MLPAEGVRTSAGPPVKPTSWDSTIPTSWLSWLKQNQNASHWDLIIIQGLSSILKPWQFSSNIKLWASNYEYIDISTIYINYISTIYQLYINYIKYQIKHQTTSNSQQFGAFHYLTCLAASGIERCADPLATCGDTERGFACARRSGGAPIPIVSHGPSSLW